MTDSYLDATKIISELGLIKLELANLRKELAKLREQQAPVYYYTPPVMYPQAPWPGWHVTYGVSAEQRTSAVEKFMADYAAKAKTA